MRPEFSWPEFTLVKSKNVSSLSVEYKYGSLLYINSHKYLNVRPEDPRRINHLPGGKFSIPLCTVETS